MASSISSLPLEVLQDILCITPAEDLGRAKFMCKQWNGIISSKTFIYRHLDRSSERFIRDAETAHIIDPVTGSRSESPIPGEFCAPNNVDTIVHCDGLMLCIRRDSWQIRDPRVAEMAFWNPILRKVKWIEPSQSLASHSRYGVGYKSRDDGYMVIKFPDRRYRLANGKSPVEIYELKNDSWRALAHVKVDWLVDSSCKGVSVMGDMYWLAHKTYQNKSYILGFDFSAERFKDVCFCPFSPRGSYLSCYSGDRLSLLQQEDLTRKIDVLVSNHLADEDVSFTKYFSVSRHDLPELRLFAYAPVPVYCFVKPKSIIAWSEQYEGEGGTFCSYLTLYEIGEDGLRKNTETDRMKHLYLPLSRGRHVYVPSLVTLPHV